MSTSREAPPARAQVRIFLEQPISLRAAPHRVQQFLGRKGFGKIIHRAGLNGFDGQFRRGEGGDHQRRRFRPELAEIAEKFVAGHTPEPRVGNNHEKFLPGHQDLRFLGGLRGLNRIAVVAQHRFERQAHIFLVINDEYGGKSHKQTLTVQSAESRINNPKPGRRKASLFSSS